MARLSLEERLNRIEDKISEKSFRENKGLGNEVGYYVFDYDPRAELEVRNHIAYLKDRINNGNKDFKIIEFDLFHTMIQFISQSAQSRQRVSNSLSLYSSFNSTSVRSGVVVLILREGSPSVISLRNQSYRKSLYVSLLQYFMTLKRP